MRDESDLLVITKKKVYIYIYNNNNNIIKRKLNRKKRILSPNFTNLSQKSLSLSLSSFYLLRFQIRDREDFLQALCSVLNQGT